MGDGTKNEELEPIFNHRFHRRHRLKADSSYPCPSEQSVVPKFPKTPTTRLILVPFGLTAYRGVTL